MTYTSRLAKLKKKIRMTVENNIQQKRVSHIVVNFYTILQVSRFRL